MSHIRTSARAILQQGGKLLVVRYRDEQGDFYALPGGSQRHGESLTDAVVREVAAPHSANRLGTVVAVWRQSVATRAFLRVCGSQV